RASESRARPLGRVARADPVAPSKNGRDIDGDDSLQNEQGSRAPDASEGALAGDPMGEKRTEPGATQIMGGTNDKTADPAPPGSSAGAPTPEPSQRITGPSRCPRTTVAHRILHPAGAGGVAPSGIATVVPVVPRGEVLARFRATLRRPRTPVPETTLPPPGR